MKYYFKISFSLCDTCNVFHLGSLHLQEELHYLWPYSCYFAVSSLVTASGQAPHLCCWHLSLLLPISNTVLQKYCMITLLTMPSQQLHHRMLSFKVVTLTWGLIDGCNYYQHFPTSTQSPHQCSLQAQLCCILWRAKTNYAHCATFVAIYVNEWQLYLVTLKAAHL